MAKPASAGQIKLATLSLMSQALGVLWKSSIR